MPRTCTICRHPQRNEIDKALLAGAPLRDIARRFESSRAALFRHKQNDFPKRLAKAKQAAEEAQAGTLFERLRAINRETGKILAEARGSKRHTIALGAIARAEKQLELEARLLGELDESVKVAVGVNVQAPPQSNYDLSKLDDEELDSLLRLLEKCAVDRGSGQPLAASAEKVN